MTDNRKPYMVTVRHLEVEQTVPHPYMDGKRFWYVIERVYEGNGDFAGWRTVSKGYAHSTSAFATLGRLLQKDIKAQQQ